MPNRKHLAMVSCSEGPILILLIFKMHKLIKQAVMPCSTSHEKRKKTPHILLLKRYF